MKETNPIELVDGVRDTLRRYIGTTLPISRRYPKLSAEFRRLLAEQDLVQGPFVEALPDFEKGMSLANLLSSNGGFLHDALAVLPHAHRPLHLHQETAIRLAVRDGKSLLVATGTGSGKTETFLYPIAHALLSDAEPDKPGVRAVLIYPMNALANDQLYYRIAPLFGRYLSEHGITFGRYTGQIKANTPREEEEEKLLNNRKLMAALDNPEHIPRNWLLTREEMLASPPKLLITNYAMLEHLLLLPRNEPLFSRHALRIVVLDEIHTYAGAQATEVAFLLRKLKNRLGISDRLQVFGTSASLSEGPGADERLIEFGEQLFGETVHAVVRGKRIAHERLRQAADHSFSWHVRDWVSVGHALDDYFRQTAEEQTAAAWLVRLQALNIDVPGSPPTNGESFGAYLERVMAANREIRRVGELLDPIGVQPFAELSHLVFNSGADEATKEERYRALAAVIRMGMVARTDEGSFPLLPGRYHIAANGIEGIAVRPAADLEGWAEIKVARQHRDDRGIYYPMLVCRRCGQPYLEAFEEHGVLRNVRPDQEGVRSERKVFWLGRPPEELVDDEADIHEDDSAAQYPKLVLDPKTGSLGSSDKDAVVLFVVHTVHEEEEKAWYVKKCPACGAQASGADAEILTRMHPGNEALASVITQRVLEALPPLEVDYTQPRPSLGRSLLTFSDNRQDAAFFAPYFERTAGDLALRSAIFQVLRDRSQPIDGRHLARQIFKLWAQEGRQPIMLDPDGEIRTDEVEVVELILGAIGAEFCTPSGRRNSLEALGLVRVTYDLAKLQQLAQKVKPLLPERLACDPQTIDALLHMLLETVRREKALARFYGIDLRSAFVWGSTYAGHRSFELQAADPAISNRWLPPQQGKRTNRRTHYLSKQLEMSKEDAMDLLRQLWDLLKREPVALLRAIQPGFGLDGEAIRFVSAANAVKYVCRSCGLLQQYSVLNKCVGFGCRGSVDQFDEEQWNDFASKNHYLVSYAEPDHLTVRAREHTASLSTELRERIELSFSDRQTNVLSCTTTMEMGVDLGDLEAVVNLNVPPGIANYQQRTGRAGRRAQAAPFCVTVAKNSQYDQAVYRDFPRYLKSLPGTPFVQLDNEELFWRHQESILLSYLLRSVVADPSVNAPSLQHLFGRDFDSKNMKAFRERVQAWLEGEAGLRALAEAESLRDRLPEALKRIGCSGPYLRGRFLASIDEFASEVSGRWERYQEKVSEFATANDHQKAAYWQRLANKFMDQFLVNQLSVRGLIPTYSFPVHSLTLEVIREQSTHRKMFGGSEIELSRDASLGISEYGPGADVVANGRIWTSEGLAQYPRQFMPDRWYVACPECLHVDIADTKDELPSACTNCGATERRRKRLFIEPRGFVTSYARRKGRDPGSSRRRVKPADEARLIASPRADQFEETDMPFLRSALLRASGGSEDAPRGTMFIANRGVYGEGYLRCSLCNFTMPKPLNKSKGDDKKKNTQKQREHPHDDPLSGSTCPKTLLGSMMGIDLVHRFDTDVRLYRFLSPLPECPAEETDPRRFAERICRTIAEACRFAAAEMLGISAGAIRATFRLFGGSPGLIEVVLYDVVPGGAGYCAKLGTPQTSHRALIEILRNRLDCPAECTGGCRQCLFDYSNQPYWDSFERTLTLEWLRGLLGEGATTIPPGGFQAWKNPSLSALEDRLANLPSIYLLGRQLIGNEPIDQSSVGLISRWVLSGKKVTVLLTEPLEKMPKSAIALETYRQLHPYAMSGNLTLAQIGKDSRDQWAVLPRVFAEPVDGAPLFKQAFPHQALLAGILAGSVEFGVCEEHWLNRLSKIIATSVTLPKDYLKEGDRLELREFSEGQPKSIIDIFSSVAGAHVTLVRVSDPFCGHKRHRNKLHRFLDDLIKLVAKIESVEIHCREAKASDNDYEHRLHMKAQVEDILEACKIEKCEVYVQDNKQPARTFHDREVDIEVVGSNGIAVMHRYFLTGGIDYLMDTRSATKVFHYRTDT